MKKVHTFAEYMADEERISEEDRLAVAHEAELIERFIQARNELSVSQRELAEISGIQQPAISRLENRKSSPTIDTLLRLLIPLGYTIKIVPIE